MKWPWQRTEKPKEAVQEPVAAKKPKLPMKVAPNIGTFGKPVANMKVLEDSERIEVCRLAASYETQQNIADWLREERGKSVTAQSIGAMLHSAKWKTLTQQFRVHFTQELMEEPLYNKRKRLQYLYRFMTKAEAAGEIKDAIDAVDSAREEAEPRRGDFSLQLNQFNMISDEELIEIRNRLENELKDKEKNRAISQRETKEVHGSRVIETEIGKEDSNGHE